MTATANFAALLTRYFTQRLIQQRSASPHTIRSYRDTFHLLLLFAKTSLGKEPSQLTIEQIDAPLVSSFLDDLQNRRGIGTRSRNLRLTAIRSFFRFAAFELPAQSEPIQRVLAIPSKRCVHKQIHYLTRPEVDALLAAPDQTTWSGRRDHAWLLLAVQTGLRASELTTLTCRDVHLGGGAYVACHGKGRKDRITPLSPGTVATLRAWLAEHAGTPDDPLFTTIRGGPMSRDALQQRLTLYATAAGECCPSLASKNVTPHVLRHSAAMALLHAGNDITVIALWLGHESVTTTQIYLQADMALKQQWSAPNLPDSGPSKIGVV